MSLNILNLTLTKQNDVMRLSNSLAINNCLTQSLLTLSLTSLTLRNLTITRQTRVRLKDVITPLKWSGRFSGQACGGLNKYRPHDRTTTAQHDGTVGRGVRVPSCCAVAGRIPFAACMKTASKTSLCKYVFHH